MKFRLSILLILLLVAGAIEGQESTSFSVDEFDYSVLGDAYVSIMACDGLLSGDVRIPSSVSYSGKSYTVTEITSLGDNPEVTSVFIPKSVVSVYSSAFNSLTGCKSFIVESGNLSYRSEGGLLITNNNALIAYPRGLSEVVIPEGVESVNCTFASGIEKVAISSSVKSLGSRVFSNSNSLLQITVASGNNTFKMVGNALLSRDGKILYAYIRGSSMVSLIPASVDSIPNQLATGGGNKLVFEGSTPPTLTSYYSIMDVYVRAGCESAFSTTQWWSFFGSDDYKHTYDFISDSLICHKTGPTEVEILGSLKCSASVNIPSTLTDGEGNSYTVTSIGVRAFYDNNAITSITLPSTLKTIGDEALYYCGVTEITLPASLQSVGRYALYSYSLQKIYIEGAPASLASALYYNSTVYVPSIFLSEYESAQYWRNARIVANDYMEDCFVYAITSSNTVSVVKCLENRNAYTIPDEVDINGKVYSVTSIGKELFQSNTDLTDIHFPAGLEDIGANAFYYCRGLETISLPNSLKSIGDMAFYGCSLLSSLELPASLESIGSMAFLSLNTDMISCIELKQSIPIILSGQWVFPSSMRFKVTPSSALAAYKADAIWSKLNVVGADFWDGDFGYKLGENNTASLVAFSRNLENGGTTSLTIPGKITVSGTDYTVTAIADSVFFRNVPNTLTIPSSVTSIGSYACYYYSNKLTLQMEGNNPPSLAENSFNVYTWGGNKTYYVSVIVNSEALEAYQTAEIWKEITSLSACDVIIDGIGYTLSDDSKATVVSVLSTPDTGVLEVPSTIKVADADCPVVGIGTEAFSNISSGRILILPKSITTISNNPNLNAFSIVYLKSTTPPVLASNNYSTVYVPTASLTEYQENNEWTDGGYSKDLIQASDGIVMQDSIYYNINDANSTAGICLWMKYQTKDISVPESVTIGGKSYIINSLLRNAFFSNSQRSSAVKTFRIPSSITSIGYQAFPLSWGMEVKVDGTTTPVLEFQNWLSSMTLYVKSEAYNSYASADEWKTFGIIIALDGSDSQFNYAKTGDGEAMITGVIDKNVKNVTIPTSTTIDGETLEITAIGDEVFKDSSVDTLNLGNSIRSIGNNAFYHCYSLKKLVLPNSVVSIGEKAFYNCGLSSITIPASLNTIGTMAFSSNGNISSMNVRAGNANFKSVNNNLLTKDGKTLIQGSSSLNNYNRYESAIQGVEAILPGALDRISINNLCLPASLKNISGDLLAGILNCNNIYVEEGSPYLCSLDGILFSNDTTKIIRFPKGKRNYGYRDYELPSQVEIVGKNAFSGVQLTSLTLSENVKTIEDQAFTYFTYDDGSHYDNSDAFPSSLIFLTETPPSATEAAFPPSTSYYNMYKTTSLYLPMGSYDDYMSISPWKNFSIVNTAKLEDEDYQLLKSFYQEMNNGEGWYYTWNLGETAEQAKIIHGARMKDGHVTSLDLSNYGLSGQVSNKIFKLPELETLNLNNNALEGVIEEILVPSEIYNESLTSLDVSNNKLSGNLGVVGLTLPNLRTLDASNNRFSDVVPVLPVAITSLDIRHQEMDKVIDYQKAIGIDDFTSEDALEAVPTLLFYNHANQNYKSSKVYNVGYSSPKWDMTITAKDGKFAFAPKSGLEYKLPNGALLDLTDAQDGHISKVKMSFEMGDVDFNDTVNVVDLSKMVNYSLDVPLEEMFNVTAADIQADEWVNVQDVVSLVNILLAQEIEIDGGNEARTRSQQSPVEALLFWRGNQLYLKTEHEISSLDIAIADTKGVRWILGDADYDYAMSNKNGYIRIIHYSITGKTIPAGETLIAEATGDNMRIVKAVLVNKESRIVKTSVADAPTSIQNVERTDGVRITANDSGIYISTTHSMHQVSWAAYSVGGHLLGKGVINLGVGTNTLNCQMTGENQVIVRLSNNDVNVTKKVFVIK